MSRFADASATDRLSFGACQCKGTPHDEDWMDLRTQLGAEDAAKLATGDSIAALGVLVVGWNFQDDDGTVAPIDRTHLGALFADQFTAIDAWVEKHTRVSTLPNASAAPSPRSSRGSGSRTPSPTTVG